MRKDAAWKTTAGLGLLALSVLGITAVLCRERILEEWWILRLRSSDSSARTRAVLALLERGTERSLVGLSQGMSEGHLPDDVPDLILSPRILRDVAGRAPARFSLFQGCVEAVQPEQRLAVISAGKKQGLEKCLFLIAGRDWRTTARLTVTKVFDDLAGAKFSSPPGSEPQIGDVVLGLFPLPPSAAAAGR